MDATTTKEKMREAQDLSFHQSKHVAAVAVLSTILTHKPFHPRANYLLSVCQMHLSTPNPTAPLSKALVHYPNKPFLHYGLALIHSQSNNNKEVEQWLPAAQQAAVLSIAATNSPTLSAIATLYRTHKLYSQAISLYLQVIEWDNTNLKAHKNLATCYRRTGHLKQAQQHYAIVLQALTESTMTAAALNNWAKSQITVELITHWFVACGGCIAGGSSTSSVAPASFVRGLYDGYADRFDDHLIKKLHYQTPTLLTNALLHAVGKATPKLGADHLPSSKVVMPFSKVCDLGCGTGLMISFMSDAGVVSPPNGIVGIDLSGAMVEKARSKNLYETLHVGDMDTVLQPGSNYTLVCCCDVYPYVGDLNEPFRRVRQSMVGSGQGYFVFSTEEWRVEEVDGVKEVGSTKEHGYKLNTTGRFVHSFEYVERMAVVNSFQVLHLESIVLRMNGGQPVHGLIGVVRTV